MTLWELRQWMETRITVEQFGLLWASMGIPFIAYYWWTARKRTSREGEPK